LGYERAVSGPVSIWYHEDLHEESEPMRKVIIQRMDMFLHHGEPYFDMAFSYLDVPGDNLSSCRLGNDAVPPYTKVGDILWAESVMNTVIRFQKSPP
jgi:hypothetical protein